MKITVATTYTNPEERRDPWKRGSYLFTKTLQMKLWSQDLIGRIIFSWELIGETFNKGFEEASGDWVMRMDIDYFYS